MNPERPATCGPVGWDATGGSPSSVSTPTSASTAHVLQRLPFSSPPSGGGRLDACCCACKERARLSRQLRPSGESPPQHPIHVAGTCGTASAGSGSSLHSLHSRWIVARSQQKYAALVYARAIAGNSAAPWRNGWL